MKINIILFLPIVFLVSCELAGNLSLHNGYPFKIRAEVVYDEQGSILKRSNIFEADAYFITRRYSKYNRIMAIKLFTMEGDLIAEYSPEYINKIRDAFNRADYREAWIFTEKGLFLGTEEIIKRYKRDLGEILKYYRSDEARSDLEKVLNK
jgi:hypothetical protein